MGGGICILTETYHPVVGGGETQARLLASGLADRGWSVTVVTRRSDASSPRRERFEGVEVRRVPPGGRGQARKWALLATTLPALFGHRHRYDLIVVSGFRILGMPALALGRLLGKPCVLKADSLGELSGDYFSGGLAARGLSTTSPAFRLFLRLRNRLLLKGRAFVAISDEIAAELVRHGVPSEAVERIPNAVDGGRFRPASPVERNALRERLGLPADRRIVVYSGRLVSYKGLPRLLEVWRELSSSHPRALLLLVGAGGLDIHNCEEELHRFVRRHGLEASVHFAGEVDNVEDYLRASDLFVFPTENEAFGLALVEAMACELPAVSTTVGGLADIVRHEENALAVRAADSRELLRALERLLDEQELAHRLGSAARRTAVEEYATERVVGLYDTLARRLLGVGGGRREPAG